MSIWIMAIIGGLLSTQIANPFFYYRIARSVSKYKHAVRSFPRSSRTKPKYIDYLEYEEIGSIKVGVIFNIVCFVVFGGLAWLGYYLEAEDRTFSCLIAYAWLFAIGNLISTFATFASARTFRPIECLQAWACAIAILIVSLLLNIYTPLYNFSHHVDANTFLTEVEVPVISVDVLNTLEKEVLIEGYSIKDPVYRNGKVIFPLSRKDTSNVSIVGYVELNDSKTPNIVLKDLHYTPYQGGSQNIKYVARDYLPTKQFFGDWSFQLSPEGDVYFAKMYGKFASLRAGRIVEGMLLINATTGECSTYSLSEIPNWINGISE